LSTSLDLFCNFQKTFETFEKTERCTQIKIKKYKYYSVSITDESKYIIIIEMPSRV